MQCLMCLFNLLYAHYAHEPVCLPHTCKLVNQTSSAISQLSLMCKGGNMYDSNGFSVYLIYMYDFFFVFCSIKGFRWIYNKGA